MATVQRVHAELDAFTINSSDGFTFIGKFCFKAVSDQDVQNNVYSGTVRVKLTTTDPNQAQGLQVYFFDDEDNSWPLAQRSQSCQDKVAKAKPSPLPVVWDNNNAWDSQDLALSETRRPRFWYFVVANCQGSTNNGKAGFSAVSGSIHFLNNDSFWYREFGFNQYGVNSIYVVFLLAYILLTCIWLWGLRTWMNVNASTSVSSSMSMASNFHSLHPLIRLMSFIVGIQLWAMFFLFLHYTIFTQDGVGVVALRTGGQFLIAFARVAFVLMLLLFAKGWTIFTVELTHRVPVAASVIVLLLSYVFLLVWSALDIDPTSTKYLYDSIPGILIISVTGVIGLAFLYFGITTLRSPAAEEPSASSKRSFLKVLLGSYTIWFYHLIFLVLISLALDPWVREKTVTAASMVVSFVFYFMLCFLLWPTRASSYFQISTADHASLSIDDGASYRQL